MIKVLLLGANGQLGTDIRRVFANEPEMEIVPIIRKDLDVADVGAIAPFLQGMGKFDVLINCTSYHKTDECEDYAQRAFLINSLAPWDMAKFCANAGSRDSEAGTGTGSLRDQDKVLQNPPPLFIHFTTDYVFGGSHSVPYLEHDATNPINVYGASKAAGEQLIRAYNNRYFILRVSSLFGVAGASGKGGNFVETMIRLANEEKPITVVNDQFMSPTHTIDIAKAVLSLIRTKSIDYGIYHCSGEGSCSWHEFAKEIFRRMGIQTNLSPCSASNLTTKARRPAYSVLDNSKLNAIHQMPHWKDALDEYIRMKHEGSQRPT